MKRTVFYLTDLIEAIITGDDIYVGEHKYSAVTLHSWTLLQLKELLKKTPYYLEPVNEKEKDLHWI